MNILEEDQSKFESSFSDATIELLKSMICKYPKERSTAIEILQDKTMAYVEQYEQGLKQDEQNHGSYESGNTNGSNNNKNDGEIDSPEGDQKFENFEGDVGDEGKPSKVNSSKDHGVSTKKSSSNFFSRLFGVKGKTDLSVEIKNMEKLMKEELGSAYEQSKNKTQQVLQSANHTAPLNYFSNSGCNTPQGKNDSCKKRGFENGKNLEEGKGPTLNTPRDVSIKNPVFAEYNPENLYTVG